MTIEKKGETYIYIVIDGKIRVYRIYVCVCVWHEQNRKLASNEISIENEMKSKRIIFLLLFAPFVVVISHKGLFLFGKEASLERKHDLSK